MLKGNSAYFLLIFYCLIYGLRNVIVKLFLIDTPPLTLTFYIYLFVVGFSFAFLKAKKQNILLKGSNKSTNKELLILSLATTLAFGTEIFSINWISPILNTLIDNSFFPVFVALFSSWLLKEKISKAIFIGLLICVVGLWVFNTRDLTSENFNFSLLGIGLALSSSIFFAMTIPYTTILVNKMSIEKIIFYRFTLSSIILLPFVLYSGMYKIDLTALLKIGVLSLIGYFFTLYIAINTLKKIPPTIFGVFFLSVPIFSFIFSLIILKTEIDFMNMIGSLIVVCGLTFTFIKQKNPENI